MWNTLASDEVLQKVVVALQNRGMIAEIVASKEEAKTKVLSLLPKDAEAMTMTSVTLQETGIAEAINSSSEYNSVRNKLTSMDRKTQGREMQKLGTAPDWAIGSIHALTEDGVIFVASNTGSQLPAYVYGSGHVIWVVGGQKIVKDEEAAKRRIYEYILPKESVRLRKQYNLPDTSSSSVSKLLTVYKEVIPGRIHIIFVKESLGF